ncbi:MAG: DUF2304 domain-containing protein, partial [Nitriliruptoraceae bacterium]
MTVAHGVAIATAVGISVVVLELVRRRQLRDKYAALFLVLATGMVLFAVAPSLLTGLATILSIISVSDALFFVGLLILLIIAVHLTWEVSRLENETRVLSEELALL